MPVDAVLAALRAGRPALIRDERDPSRVPVLVAPADANWAGEALDRYGSGGLTLALDAARLDRFVFDHPLSRLASSRIGLKGADDVFAVAKAVLDPSTSADAFEQGGGLRLAPVRGGGLLATRSLEAGAHDLVRLAVGSTAALVINARPDAETNLVPVASLTDIAAYRERSEVLVEEVASARLPSRYGGTGLVARAFISLHDGIEHLALVKGQPEPGALIRIHSECLTGDVLGSMRCDCGEQLHAAIARISAASSGVLLYVRGHEGRGIGLANKIRAYALQDLGLDTAEANTALGFPHDARDYAVAAQIIKQLGLFDVRLLTNNPRKGKALATFGVMVREEVALVLAANAHNIGYLNTKRDKLGHRLPKFDGSLGLMVGQG